MKTIVKIFVLFVCISSIYSQDVNRFINSKWELAVTEEASNYIIFNSDTSYMQYDCELDQKFYGH